ncbi:hypothetical protein K3495_g6454 [Podosphaera aphanis]|nr:hypothetical protein K3495_g6454 [Podosphaera aphanis]
MTLWRDEYLQALKDDEARRRAKYPQIDNQLIDEFTNLTNRIAAYEAERAASKAVSNPGGLDSITRNREEDSPEIVQLKSDLAEALRSRSQFDSRSKAVEAEATKLRAKIKSDTKILDELCIDRTALSQKLRDRDEELRGKTKLLAEVQDEVVSLILQLNMSEQKVKDLELENKFLIDRWMAQKHGEAEEMNKNL